MSRTKKNQSKPIFSTLVLIAAAVLVLLGQQLGLIPAATPETPTAEGTGQAFCITEPQALVNYLAAHDGQLPDNFITKAEAQALGWDSSNNHLSDVAPGKSIGGDRFGNYEGLLPAASGRQYHEADCYYTEGPRNANRLVYSTDGLYFYTEDHYATFKELYPEQ